jgi:hypothetical protein
LFGLVLDCSSLVPCGEKPEEMKEAIRWLGSTLPNPNLTDRVIIYFSQYLIKVYYTKVKPLLERHHPLPAFQASLLRVLPRLRMFSSELRGFLCKTRSTDVGVRFHVLERTRVHFYDVNDVGLTEEEDKEVLRIAFASAHQKVFLVTANHAFFENLNQTKLEKKYPNESQKVKIVKPNDPDFRRFLAAFTL